MGLLYLHCAEQQAAYFEARKFFDKKNQPIDSVGEEQFQLEVEYQLLYRMILQPDAENPSARLFANVQQVRAELTPNEATSIIGEHIALQRAEVEDWILGKADPHLRQIARALGVDEATEPEALVELVTQLKTETGSDDG